MKVIIVAAVAMVIGFLLGLLLSDVINPFHFDPHFDGSGTMQKK